MVRSAAAGLAFNFAAAVGKARQGGEAQGKSDDGDWEVEVASALVEAVGREEGSEEVGKWFSDLV